MATHNLELWQTEWCPASQRVRQRMTELGLTYLVRQVPVERGDRAELVQRTGHESIPVLVIGEDVLAGEQDIVTYLNTRYAEPAEAARQRAKAAKARTKQLEKACQELAANTH